MLELLPDYLEHLVDHRLQGAYLGQLVTTWQYRPLSDSEQLEKTAIEHFKAAGDMAGEGEPVFSRSKSSDSNTQQLIFFVALACTSANTTTIYPRPSGTTKER
jgi:hypothetical protein